MATKNFNRDFFNAILSNVDAMTLPSGMTASEMREWATHQIDLLNRKNVSKKPTATQNAGDKKPTAKQMENDAVKQVILDEMTANPDKLYTVTDLIKGVPELAEYSNQRVSALLRQMIDANTVVKTVDKRKSYFRLAH